MTSRPAMLLLIVWIMGYPVGAQFRAVERPAESLAAARLDAWAQRRADASLPALVLHPKFGLGNRMLSAISALALAIATDRRLFVEWEHPFAGLFDSPFDSAWQWPGQEGKHAAAQQMHLDLTASSPTFPRYAAPPLTYAPEPLADLHPAHSHRRPNTRDDPTRTRAALRLSSHARARTRYSVTLPSSKYHPTSISCRCCWSMRSRVLTLPPCSMLRVKARPGRMGISRAFWYNSLDGLFSKVFYAVNFTVNVLGH